LLIYAKGDSGVDGKIAAKVSGRSKKKPMGGAKAANGSSILTSQVWSIPTHSYELIHVWY